MENTENQNTAVKSKSMLPIAIVIAGVLIALAIFFTSNSNMFKGGTVSLDVASQKALDFVNNKILGGQIKATIVAKSEENGLYKVKFNVSGQEVESYLTKDGKLFFPEAIDLSKVDQPAETEKTVGQFSVTSEQICMEANKPIVYFFGSEQCPHCKWELPIAEKVAAKFKDKIVFKKLIDSQESQDIFKKYSDGSIPLIVMGCKYYRVGSGEINGKTNDENLKTEENNLTALMCKLTGTETSDTCKGVADLISQIK